MHRVRPPIAGGRTHRRSLLLGLAAAALGRPVLAQSVQGPAIPRSAIPRDIDDARPVGASYDDIVARGHIDIVVYRDFPPFSYRDADNELVGIDVDLARSIGEGLGVRTNLLELTADETVDDDLRNGVWKGPRIGGKAGNVMLHVPNDRELDIRNELAVLLGPYYTEEIMVARDPARIDDSSTPAIFQYEPVGVEVDSISDFYLSSAFGGRLRAAVRRFLPFEEAFAALKSGELAAVMGPKAQLQHGVRGMTEIVVTPMALPGLYLRQWNIGFAIRDTYRQLGYAVGDVIRATVESGRMAEIFAAHGIDYRRPEYL